MKEYTKPLPEPTSFSKPFWDGTKRHELLIQKCKDCQEFVFYPKVVCPFCLSDKLEWVKASGRGRVYTYMVVYSYQPRVFAEDVPYVVAVIDLEEGVRLMSNIVECDPERVHCDMDVTVVFDDVTDEFTLPKFKPLS
jgi:uncharacterized OB-fold protein